MINIKPSPEIVKKRAKNLSRDGKSCKRKKNLDTVSISGVLISRNSSKIKANIINEMTTRNFFK